MLVIVHQKEHFEGHMEGEELGGDTVDMGGEGDSVSFGSGVNVTYPTALLCVLEQF